MGVGGYLTAPRSVRLLRDSTAIKFEHRGNRTILQNLPRSCPDSHAGVTVIAMEFAEAPKYVFASGYPQLHGGRNLEG